MPSNPPDLRLCVEEGEGGGRRALPAWLASACGGSVAAGCAVLGPCVFWSSVVAAVVVVVSEVPLLSGVDGLLAAPAVDLACFDLGCPFGS